MNCEGCNAHLTTVQSFGRYHFFKCNACKKKFSVRKNTFLSQANVSLRKFILLIYIFVSNFWSYKQIQRETDLTSSESDNSDDNKDGSSSSVLAMDTISKYFTTPPTDTVDIHTNRIEG
jgi:hypothetical protein